MTVAKGMFPLEIFARQTKGLKKWVSLVSAKEHVFG
jgi:hypothetical protein